jgi:NADH-quinone oxidoreductase subunit N|tara:strand:+ start:767 stop:2293 length:1527 start_codon:yes stop_codon:yes gene_type:complete
LDIFIFKAFWPELFLSLSIIFLLLFDSQLINNLKFQFPVLENEIFFQIYTVLFYVFLLFLNNKILGYDSNLFFLNDLTSQNVKIFFSGFCLLFFVIIWRSFVVQKLNFFEYFIILLLAILSLFFLSNSFNLLSIYLCLELQSISFYVLASFQRNSIFSSEAGLKYFISSSLISGIFLLGCAFIYGSYGTLNLHSINILNMIEFSESYQLVINFITLGSFCIIGAFLFKLVIAPFHFWFPQIYDGSPLSATIIFSTLPKIILFTLFLRFWSVVSPLLYFSQTVLFLIGVFSIFFGLLKALKQKRLKKLYIYSSISQIGLPLCALVDNSLESFTIVYFFLFIYLLTSVLMWGTFVLINTNQNKVYLDSKNKINTYPIFISSLKHLITNNPALALAFMFLLFSLAGIPPFAGFLSKIYVYFSLIQGNKYEIASIIFYVSAFGVYYYIKILKVIFYENVSLTYHVKSQSSFNSANLDLDYTLCSLVMFLLLFLCFFPNIVYMNAAQLVFYSF